MSQRAKIQRQREKAAPLPSVQKEAAQDSPFASRKDADEAPSIVDEVLSSGGQPLDSEARSYMEPRFGHDFSQVRIHADERSGANENTFGTGHAQPVARLTDAAATEEVIGPEGGPLSSNLASSIQAERGNGAPLNTPVREQMEQTLGANFADVRLHADSASYAFNHSVGARAFTVGSDIFLGPKTNPDETQLLAHELTHVVQQRNMGNGGPMVVGPADDTCEQEASMTSATIAANVTPAVEDAAGGAHQVQRLSEDVPLNREAGAAHAATGAFSRSGTGLLIQREGPTVEERVAKSGEASTGAGYTSEGNRSRPAMAGYI